MVHDGKDIKDKAYKDLCAEMYAEGHSFFTYISDSADSLASCCYSGDTQVFVQENGQAIRVSFKELSKHATVGQKFKIFSNGDWKTGKLVKLPARPMYKVCTSCQQIMYVTDNHRNNCLRGTVLTKDLNTSDYIMVCDTPDWKLDINNSDIITQNGVYYARIVSVEEMNYEDDFVYCFTMDDANDDKFTLADGIHNYNCRLRNELAENTFSPTSGLSGIMTGSCNVISLNINRIVQKAVRSSSEDSENNYHNPQNSFSNYKDEIKESLVNILDRVYKYHIAFKTMLYDLEDKGMFAACNGGYIHMNKLYSTVGVNGLNEAARFLGLEVSNNPEYFKFLQLILGTIKDKNKKHSIHDKKRPFLFNSEVVPRLSGYLKPLVIDLKLLNKGQQGASKGYSCAA